MDKITVADHVRAFGLDPERIFGYFFSSMLLVLVAYFVDRAAFVSAAHDLGMVNVYVLSFVPGTIIYILHRRVVGEYLLFPIQHALHGLLDLALNFGRRTSSPIWYLFAAGVPLLSLRAAFQIVRDHVLDNRRSTAASVSHGEVSVFYLCALQSGVAYCWSGGQVWALTAAGALAIAMAADTKTHQDTLQLIRTVERPRLITALRAGGLRIVETRAAAFSK